MEKAIAPSFLACRALAPCETIYAHAQDDHRPDGECAFRYREALDQGVRSAPLVIDILARQKDPRTPPLVLPPRAALRRACDGMSLSPTPLGDGVSSVEWGATQENRPPQGAFTLDKVDEFLMLKH